VLVAENMVFPVLPNRVTVFKEAWRWTKDEEAIYARFLKGFTLHLCCGKSLLGDIRIDVDRRLKPTIVADQNHLPFKDKVFDTALWDPPWINNQNYRVGFKLAKVVKKRIIAISNTWVYIPKPFTLTHLYVLKKVSPVVKLVFIYENLNRSLEEFTGEQQTLDVWVESF